LAQAGLGSSLAHDRRAVSHCVDVIRCGSGAPLRRTPLERMPLPSAAAALTAQAFGGAGCRRALDRAVILGTTALVQRCRAPPICSPWNLGAASFASSSSSRAARKKKQKLKLRYWKPTPERLLRQKDGDFPVQLRPAGVVPEVRDLQDSSFDAQAAAEEDEGGFGKTPRPKPHKVRQALRERWGETQEKDPHAWSPGASSASVHEVREKTRLSAGGGKASPRVLEFKPERDMSEEDAADMAAMRARALARRNYKWMPNPFGPKPGPLGPGPQAEARYYERYFDGHRPAEEGLRRAASLDGEELRDPGSLRPERERISPKRFWYQSDYVAPDPPSVAMMNSRELKFAMVNEAHNVRKWRNGHPEGRAAGMPPGSGELWLAFGLRAAELAHVGTAAAAAVGSRDLLVPGTSSPEVAGVEGGGEEGEDEEALRGRRPPQRCSLSTTLRFLQAMASVQAGPYTALRHLMSRVLESLQDLRPHQCFFLLQAMSRLRIKHPKSPLILQHMSLAWRTLPPKKLVKAANAVAKLDLGGHLWAKPLKLSLWRTLSQFSGKHFANLKAITVIELLDDPEALRAYLDRAEELRGYVRYSRHLRMIEIHVHLLHPELWESLDDQVRLFLQQVRTAAEQSSEGDWPTAQRSTRGRRRQSRWGRSRVDSQGANGSASEDEASDSDSNSDGSDNLGARRKPVFDRQRFSSALHEDISRVLSGCLGIEHHNKLAAGPLTVDMCHVPTMTVVEAAAPWQFYARSPQMTALARRRQELLRAMGFKIVRVPYHRWESLDTDDAKVEFLRGKLPAELLPAVAAH